MADNLLEASGFVLLVVFAALVWPPLGFLAAGLVCLLIANVRAARKAKAAREATTDPRGGDGRAQGLVERLVRAWLAAKSGSPDQRGERR